MPNQPLENLIESLRHPLRFLPETDREAELAEFRSHLQERLSAYENAGETPEQALASALQKWGGTAKFVRELRYRWLRHKIDHPALIALCLLGAGQYSVYGLSLVLYRYYRLLDPREYLGHVQLFPKFPGSLQAPPHAAEFPYIPLQLGINLLVAVGVSLFVARLHLKNQTKGALLFTAVHFLLFFLSQEGAVVTVRNLTQQDFLLNTGGYLQSLLWLFVAVLYSCYYPLVTLLILRSRKRIIPFPLRGKAA